ncbi:MAG: helix-turn-helix transcriptional regulator [Ignavibacteria bacterium]
MLESTNKLKRQIEILGLCLSQNHPQPLKTFDLADIFSVEELTIKRDLQELRTSGVEIHSEKRKGVCVTGVLARNKLVELIHQYSAVSFTDDIAEKSTSLLVNKLGEKSLANMVVLQLCVETCHTAVIDYETEHDSLEFRREINPVLIFERDNYWRVLAFHDSILKQFHLNKLIEVRMSDKIFNPVDKEKIEDVFRYSWRSWLGTEKFYIKVKLEPTWAKRLMPKQLMESEKITENPDGSVIFEATVNSLDEVASWAVSRGKGILILEPDELRLKVIQIAKDTLGNYK